MSVDQKTKMAIKEANTEINRTNLLIGFLVGLGLGSIGITKSIVLFVLVVSVVLLLLGYVFHKKSELNTMMDQDD